MFAANEVDNIKGDNKLIEKCRKLSKTRKLLKNLKLSRSENLKSEKLSKFRKLAKSGKKLLKSKNSFNFDTKKNGPSFLTLNAKMIFNRLWLVFIKVLIFWYFNLKCYI